MKISNKENKITSSVVSGIGKRISDVTDMLGSMRKAAKIAGKSDVQISRYIKGEAIPPVDVIVLLAKAAGISAEWLATGKGPKWRVQGQDPAGTEPGISAYTYIPIYSIHAEPGFPTTLEPIDAESAWAFRKDWIQHVLNSQPEDLCLVIMTGDAMSPTIQSGDVILIDTHDDNAGRDGIYALLIDDALLVKRIQNLSKDKIRLSSDNPAYEPFEMEKQWLLDDGEGASVLGRVVWSGRRM